MPPGRSQQFHDASGSQKKRAESHTGSSPKEFCRASKEQLLGSNRAQASMEGQHPFKGMVFPLSPWMPKTMLLLLLCFHRGRTEWKGSWRGKIYSNS